MGEKHRFQISEQAQLYCSRKLAIKADANQSTLYLNIP
jgi:hypothetical protein